ncbi:unnamed protein product [Calypogeia fissa]
MASEQLSPGSDVASGDVQQEEKPSFMTKMKEKARGKALKLKSKLKHDSPTSGNAAEGPTDKDLDQSDTTESDGEAKHDDKPSEPTSMPHPTRPAGAIIPNSEDSPMGAVGSEQSGDAADTMKTEDESFPQDPSVLKSEGPAETEQAVPTNYSYFNADPEKANLPSDDATSQRQQEVPSSLDGESAGLVEPSQPSEESLMSEPVEQDQGVTSREPSSLNPQTPQNSPQDEEEFSGFATDTPSTDKGIDGTPEEWKDTTSSNPDPDTMGGATYGNTSAEQDQEDHHHGHERLAAAAAGAAGAGAVGAGLEHKFGSSKDEAPVKDEELNSSNLAEGDPDEQKPTSEPVNGVSNQDRSFAPSQEQDESGMMAASEQDEQKPTSESGNTFAEQDQEDHHHGHEGLAAAGAGAVGAGLEHKFGSSKDEAPVKDEELNSSNLAEGDPDEQKPTSEPVNGVSNQDRSFAPSQEQDESGMMAASEQDEQKPTSEPGNTSAEQGQEDHHHGHEGLAAAGAAGGGAVGAGLEHEFGSSKDEAPVKDEELNSSNLAEGDPDEQKPTSEPVNGVSNQDRSFAPSQEQDESGMMAASEQDEQKPTSEPGNTSAEQGQEDHHHGHEGLAAAAAGAAGGGAVGAGLEHEFGSSKDEAPVKDEELNSSNLAEEDPDVQKPTSEPVDAVSNQDKSFPPSQEQDGSEMMAAAEQDEQKPITGTSGYGDNSASQGEELPSKDGESGYAGDQAMADSTPVPDEATDYTAEGEDAPANDTMISSHDQDLSSEEKHISEKPSEAAAAFQAEESPMQTTNPEATTQAEEAPMPTTNPVHEEGKAPADSKSSASTFASRLGFGGRNATPSPTSIAPTSESTQDQPAPASPGLFGRVTAMFGGGAKQPAASEGEKTVE